MCAILVNIHNTVFLINIFLFIIGFVNTARNVINLTMSVVADIFCEDGQEDFSASEIAELLRDHEDEFTAAFTLDTLVPEEEELFEYTFPGSAAVRQLPDNSFDEHLFYEYFHSEAYAGDLAYNHEIQLPSGVFCISREYSGGLIVDEDSMIETELAYEAMEEDVSIVDFGLVRTQSCYF